uniref:Uncharacterized protein n=1 Tax=Sphaerodactylus townsendi TaxID=933632 RepID=A0ACB8FHT2_9SAUR
MCHRALLASLLVCFLRFSSCRFLADCPCRFFCFSPHDGFDSSVGRAFCVGLAWWDWLGTGLVATGVGERNPIHPPGLDPKLIETRRIRSSLRLDGGLEKSNEPEKPAETAVPGSPEGSLGPVSPKIDPGAPAWAALLASSVWAALLTLAASPTPTVLATFGALAAPSIVAVPVPGVHRTGPAWWRWYQGQVAAALPTSPAVIRLLPEPDGGLRKNTEIVVISMPELVGSSIQQAGLEIACGAVVASLTTVALSITATLAVDELQRALQVSQGTGRLRGERLGQFLGPAGWPGVGNLRVSGYTTLPGSGEPVVREPCEPYSRGQFPGSERHELDLFRVASGRGPLNVTPFARDCIAGISVSFVTLTVHGLSIKPGGGGDLAFPTYIRTVLCYLVKD